MLFLVRGYPKSQIPVANGSQNGCARSRTNAHFVQNLKVGFLFVEKINIILRNYF